MEAFGRTIEAGAGVGFVVLRNPITIYFEGNLFRQWVQ